MINASWENFRCLSDGKDDNTWAQPPEPQTLVLGDNFSVVVTHVKSPSEFIVQKVENASKRRLFSCSEPKALRCNMYLLTSALWLTGVIQTLQVQLREHCSQVSPHQNFRPAPGTVCCAQFSGATHTCMLTEKSPFNSVRYHKDQLRLKCVL